MIMNEGRGVSAPDVNKPKVLEPILVIDDEPGLRESMRIFLQSRYKVTVVESVDRGLDRLREENPRMVILDMSMPVKDGLQGLREICPLRPDLPILILTGYADEATLKEAMQLGARGFMKKPFDLVEMLGVIEQYVKQ